MEVKSRIRQYISGFIHGYELQDEDNYFEKGLVNSLFAMQLVMFVEKEFAVIASGADINLDNFKSIQAISDFVQRKAALRT